MCRVVVVWVATDCLDEGGSEHHDRIRPNTQSVPAQGIGGVACPGMPATYVGSFDEKQLNCFHSLSGDEP